jgi:MFS family permease
LTRPRLQGASRLPAVEPARGVASDPNALAADVVLVAAGMLTGLSMSGLTPVLPRIEAEFSSTPGISYLGKLVVSVVGLAVMCAAPLSALAVRRFRADKVVVAAFSVYAASAAAAGLVTDVYQLVFARFVQGLCVAIGVTTALALISTLYDGRARDRRLGLHMGLSALALTFLLPLCGLLGEWSWRLTPLLGLVSLVHAALAIRGRSRLAGATVSAPSGSTAAGTGGRLAIETALLAFLVGVATYSPPVFLPFKLNAIGVVSPWQIGLVATLMMICAAAVGLFYGAFSTRISSRAVFVAGFGLGGLGLLIVGLASSRSGLLLGVFLGGLGGGTLVPHIYGDCAVRFGPGERVWATGLIKSASFCGLFAGPIALQAVMNASSASGVFVALASVMLAGLLATQRRRAAPAPLGDGIS